MHPLSILAVALALQAVSVPQSERTPDLQAAVRDNAVLGSVAVVYSVEGKSIAVRGDGTVLRQSTKQLLPLLPTCKGAVGQQDVRHLLELILAVHFFDLQQKSYMLINQDWGTLQMHSISVKGAGGSAKRDFSAGEYNGRRQEIPQEFEQVEKAIIDLEAKAISPQAHCTVGRPLLFEDTAKVAAQ